MIRSVRVPRIPEHIEGREEGRGGIHERVVGALRYAGILDPLTYWHTPNGGRVSPAAAQARARAGVLSGVPDLLFTGLCVPSALEIKTTRGRVSPEQMAWLERHDAMGWRCAVGWGYDQCIEILRDWGCV